jgi:hypothetical protein
MKSNYVSSNELFKDFTSYVDENEEIFDKIEELSDYESLDLSNDSNMELLEEVKPVVTEIINITVNGKKIDKTLANEIDRNMRNILSIKKYF